MNVSTKCFWPSIQNRKHQMWKLRPKEVEDGPLRPWERCLLYTIECHQMKSQHTLMKSVYVLETRLAAGSNNVNIVKQKEKKKEEDEEMKGNVVSKAPSPPLPHPVPPSAWSYCLAHIQISISNNK